MHFATEREGCAAAQPKYQGRAAVGPTDDGLVGTSALRDCRLAFRTSTRGASANRRVAQTRAVPRAMAAFFPAMLKKPRLGWIGKIRRDDGHRRAADKFNFAPKYFCAGAADQARGLSGKNFRAPKNFVRHPVSDSGKIPLQKQNRLEGRAPRSRQNGLQSLERKLLGEQIRGKYLPPVRRLRPLIKSNATKLPGIGKDERACFLKEHQVIVPRRLKICRLDAQFAGHAQMQAEPAAAGKLEQELFAVRTRCHQFGPSQGTAQLAGIGSLKNPGNLSRALAGTKLM